MRLGGLGAGPAPFPCPGLCSQRAEQRSLGLLGVKAALWQLWAGGSSPFIAEGGSSRDLPSPLICYRLRRRWEGRRDRSEQLPLPQPLSPLCQAPLTEPLVLHSQA